MFISAPYVIAAFFHYLFVFLILAPLLLTITIPLNIISGAILRKRRGNVTPAFRKAVSFFLFISLSLGVGATYEMIHFVNTPFLFPDSYCYGETGVSEDPTVYTEFPNLSVVCMTKNGGSIETVAAWVNPVLLLLLFHSGAAFILAIAVLFRKGDPKQKSPSPSGDGLIIG